MNIPKKEIFTGNRNDFRYWAFIALVSQKKLGEIPEWESLCTEADIDIEIKINGVEVSFFKFIERIESAHVEMEKRFDKRHNKLNQLIDEKAREIVAERFSNTFTALENFVKEFDGDMEEYLRSELFDSLKGDENVG
jgi:hypothetical protein